MVNNSSVTTTTTATAADRIFELLKEAIVTGEIKSGSKISEPELAKRFEISRGTLRDALARLEGCNLLTRKPNVGARVIELSVEQLIEIFKVREALEGMACRLAASAMTEAEITQLRKLLEAHHQEEALQQGTGYIQPEGDLDFHYQIVLGSKNSQLIRLLCNELYYLVRMYRYQFGMHSPRAKRAFREHENIINAIADGDGELAEMLMRKHIAASRLNVEKRFLNNHEESL